MSNKKSVTTTEPRCRCGCPAEAHQHYRGGTDCGLCTCPAYRAWRKNGQ